MRSLRALALAVVLAALAPAAGGAPGTATAIAVPASAPRPASPPATRADLDALHAYIHGAWSSLTRSHRDLARAAVDPKFPVQNGRATVYVSRRENLRALSGALAATLPPSELARFDLRSLPRDPSHAAPGLLYLPHPYVVPGGRFNEMYGWDSYFIVRGLLRDGQPQRARDMVDNAVYEVIHFGKVLNANRSYYLGRSQPPFLTRMILAVYHVTHDRAWLAGTLPAVRAQYHYWTREPHLAGKTGLARYHAGGEGPAPEVEAGERDAAGRTHYDRMVEALRSRTNGDANSAHADADADVDVDKYFDRKTGRLTALAYVADRSVRESGFDPSDRFGPFSLEILDYAPVCLNSLLFAMESDMAEMLTAVGDIFDAQGWRHLAELRRRRVNDLLWDDSRGLFADDDFVHGRRRWYPFATTFFPLWVGLATPEQARRVAAAALPLLERAGGIMTSTHASGNQWDAPFGWAPLQLIAVEGLRRYGLDHEADRIALEFLGTVLKEFAEHRSIFEKYDVERRESEVSSGIRFGYASNEIGFGWTNGVFLELEAGLPPARRTEIVGAAAP